MLKKHKVNIPFGSDSYGRSSFANVLYLNQIGIYTNLEALKIRLQDTPRTIFPQRRIGRLKNGYEASFIVLEGNPLERFDSVKSINRRFKQGEKIDLK